MALQGQTGRSGHHFAGQRRYLNGLEVVVEHIYVVTDEFLGQIRTTGKALGTEEASGMQPQRISVRLSSRSN